MAYSEKSFLGSGVVSIRQHGTSGQIMDLGNCTSVVLGISSEQKSLRDARQTGGGKINAVDRVTDAQLTIVMRDFTDANLARAVFGTTTAVTAAGVTDEAHTAYTDGLINLAYVPDTGVAVVITSDPAGTTYVLGTDYEWRGSALYWIGADATDILVDYTKAAGGSTQALTAAAQEWYVVINGENEAQSGDPFRVQAYRVKFKPLDSLELLGEEYVEISVQGEILKDTTRSTAQGQYFGLETGANS